MPDPTSPIPDLDSLTLCGHFGLELPPYATPDTVNSLLADAMLDGRLNPKAVTDVHEAVTAAVRQLQREIAGGGVKPRLRLVCGRPLSDWLSLDDVARLLRQGGL